MNSTIIVFILYFFVLLGMTFFVNRKQQAMSGDYSSDFFVGGRQLGPVALGVLIAAGVLSSGTFVSAPGQGAEIGPGYNFFMLANCIPLSLYVLGVFGKKINIIGRRTNSQTYIDIFRHRFENYLPLMFVLIIAILVALISAAVAEFIGGSRTVQVMTGIPYELSIIIFGIIITLYTALGGLRGIAIVGIFQAGMMTLASLLLVLGYLNHFGGLENIFNELRENDLKKLTPFAGQFSFIHMIGIWFTYGLALVGFPWAIQGALGYKSTKTMKYALIIGILLGAFWLTFVSIFGGAAGGALGLNLESPDFTIPALTQEVLPGALAGLVISGITSAGQSTIAALFILGSGSIVVNVYRAFINPGASQKKIKHATWFSVGGIGLLTIIIALNPPHTLQVLFTFALGGSFSSLVSPLLLGLYWPRANKYGAFAGLLIGLIAYPLFSLINLGIPVLQEAPILFAFPLSFITTVIVSLLSKKPTKETLQIYFGEM